MTRKNTFPSDIVLGEKYIDEQTGFRGVATSVTFFQHACERICLEDYDPTRKEIKEQVFDAPRLTAVKSGLVAKTEKTGGPQLPNAQRGPVTR